MVVPISDWRTARSFIGATSTEEAVELDFNIGTREAIEIASVLGIMNVSSVTETATIAPVIAEQSLHIEDGTIEVLNTDEAEADQFDNDSEVIYQQSTGIIAFNGTTEGAAVLYVNPSGIVVFAEPILSPINLTHRVDNDAGLMGFGGILLIEYRYVELSDRELAFQFARRRR